MNIHELIKWTGTICMFLSAMAVSFVVEWSVEWWAFMGFFCGHVIWSVYAIILREPSLLALNGIFLLIDSYAIYIRM